VRWFIATNSRRKTARRPMRTIVISVDRPVFWTGEVVERDALSCRFSGLSITLLSGADDGSTSVGSELGMDAALSKFGMKDAFTVASALHKLKNLRASKVYRLLAKSRK
jgi:hypothetical protein